jgi:hypothetical protein
MGQAGECIGGGGGGGSSSSDSSSSSESQSESQSSSSSSGGGASGGGGSAGGGASGGGASGGGAAGGGAAGGGASGGGASGGGASGSGGAEGGGTPGTGGAGGVGEFPGESSEERAARLGRELDESIGGFDETLQEEQRTIAGAGRVMEGFDIGEEEGGRGAGELIGLGSQTAMGGAEGGGSGNGSVGGPQASPMAGLSQQDIEERTPDDVPAMVDDDIIARQLREAALVEEDPALRERLWDEYRKYKGISTAN